MRWMSNSVFTDVGQNVQVFPIWNQTWLRFVVHCCSWLFITGYKLWNNKQCAPAWKYIEGHFDLRIIILLTRGDVIKWKHFPRYWPFVRGIHRSPVNSPHKGQWRGALMIALICTSKNGWVNNRKAGDLRRHRVHYDAIVMNSLGDDAPIVGMCSCGIVKGPNWVCGASFKHSIELTQHAHHDPKHISCHKN